MQTESSASTSSSEPFKPSLIFLAFWSALFFAADMATKAWAVSRLENTDITRIVVIENFFHFNLAKNRGGAFGFLSDQQEAIRFPFFLIVSAVAVFFVFGLFRKLEPTQTALKWALPFVLGGAAGNLVDRLRHRYVIDFIDIFFTFLKTDGGRPYHWPTFNVADIWICVGVGLMAIDMFTHRKPAEAPAQQSLAEPEKPSQTETGS